MLRALGCLLVLSLLLSACDFDLSDEPNPDRLPVLLPLAVGNAWATDLTRDWIDEDRPDDFSADTIRVVDAREVNGETWYEVRNDRSDGFPDGYYTNRRDGVYRADIRTPLAELPNTVSIPGAAFLIYKFPAQVGDTYDVYNGIQVTVVATNAPVTLPFGRFEAYVYEFRPTEAWLDTFPANQQDAGLAEGAGVHYATFIPELGFADFKIAFMAITAGTEEALLFETVLLNSWLLSTPPVLFGEDAPDAVPPSAEADAQRRGGLGAEAGLLGVGEAAPVAVGEGAVERPE